MFFRWMRVCFLCLACGFTARANERLEQFYRQWMIEVGTRLEWTARSFIYARQPHHTHLTLASLAPLLEADKSSVWRILYGESPISHAQGVRAAKAFEVSEGWIMAYDLIRRQLPVDIYGIPQRQYRNFRAIAERALQLSERELEVVLHAPCLVFLKAAREQDLIEALKERGWTISVRSE